MRTSLPNGSLNSSDPTGSSGEENLLFSTNYVIIYAAALFCVILTIGGNFLVLVSFRVEKKIRTVSNYYIFSLAVADLGVGLYSMSIYVMRLIVSTPPLDLPPVSPIMCYGYLTFDHLLTHVSIFNIIAIGVDRFLSIEDPMRYRAKRTSLQVKKIICFVWLGCFVFWFLIVFVWPAIARGINFKQDFCNPYYESTPVGSILAALVYFWIPTPILFGLYVKLYRTSARMKQSMNSNVVLTEQPQPDRRSTLTAVSLSSCVKLQPQNTTQAAAAAAVDLSGAALFVLANKNADQDLGSMFNTEISMSSNSNGVSTSATSSFTTRLKAPMSTNHLRVKGQNYHRSMSLNPHNSTRKISSMLESVASMAEAQNKKAFKAFTFILGALVLTWTPWASLVIIRSLVRDETFLENTSGLYNFSYFFTYINSTVNPLCYALASRTFANTFYRILCCKLNNLARRSISLNSFPYFAAPTEH